MDIKSKIIELFEWLQENLGSIINVLNPLHDDFFLKQAFVPSETYMQGFYADIKERASGKFPFVQQLHDTWASIQNIQEVSEWEGIKYNNPLVGEVVILSPIAVNSWGYKLKYWIGGAIVLLTLIMTFRRIGGIIGGNIH